MPRGTNRQPELWFRSNAAMPLDELQRLIAGRALTRTPRLGVRDANHPKGYATGQTATLRLVDAHDTQQLVAIVVVKNLLMRRIHEITPEDLAGCGPWYRTWRDVAATLTFFERREVFPAEPVTIVEFAYVDEKPTPEMEQSPWDLHRVR